MIKKTFNGVYNNFKSFTLEIYKIEFNWIEIGLIESLI